VNFWRWSTVPGGYLRVRKEFSYMHTPHPIDPLIAVILAIFGW
jgi:hypothetical protein